MGDKLSLSEATRSAPPRELPVAAVARAPSDPESTPVEAVVEASAEDTLRSLIYSGRPMRVLKNQWTERFAEKHPGAAEKAVVRGRPVAPPPPFALRLTVCARSRLASARFAERREDPARVARS